MPREPKPNYMYGNLQETVNSSVHTPIHYKFNKHSIECIDAIQASMSNEEFKGYLKGNFLKYAWRYSYKGKPLEDLEKAEWYLKRLISVFKKDNSNE